MNSKIRVEHEFGTGQTWLQMYVSTAAPSGEQPDLRDSALKNFIEQAINPDNELSIQYPEDNKDNSVAQIIIRQKVNRGHQIWENSKELSDWLTANDIQFEVVDQSFILSPSRDPFMVGAGYGRYQQLQILEADKLNWVGLNAKCLKKVNNNFKVGQSYNLLMATGLDHKVYAKGSGHIVRTGDEMEFAYLAEFIQAWEINDVGRFDVGKQAQ